MDLDPTRITTGPQAAVMIVLIIAVLVVPSVLTYLGNLQTKAVARTLTENNGGSTVKDSLDRIEAGQLELTRRVTALEADRIGGAHRAQADA